MKTNYVSYICLKPFGSFEFYIIQMLGKMKGYRYVFDIWQWLIAEILLSDLVLELKLSSHQDQNILPKWLVSGLRKTQNCKEVRFWNAFYDYFYLRKR